MENLSSSRRQNGSLVEIPLVVFVLFMVFVFPLINLGTLSLRHGLFSHACRRGAFCAATAHTFATGSDLSPSALDCGTATVYRIASDYPGIDVENVDVTIIAVDMANGAATKYPGKLPAPADTSKYLYFLELTSTAQLRTLVALPFDMSQWRSTVSVREFVENPQGLDN